MNSRRLRVLMITGRADPGGGPEHLFQLSKFLGGTCNVFIASPNERPYWERFRDLVGTDSLFEIPHRRFSRSTLGHLAAWCREREIDVVHSHGRAAGAYSRLIPKSCAKVCVHTPHGSMQLGSAKDIGYWLAEVVLAQRTDHVIAVSKSESEQLRRRLFVGSKLTAIPNGVQLPVRAVNSSACTSSPLRIVHVTRFVAQKNSEMVLAIMAALNQMGVLDRFHVDFLGDGPGRHALEKHAQALGLARHATFHGSQPSIGHFLVNGFCLLTTSRWEGMPLAVLEALACGLPVVASDTPGNNDVVNPDLGRLFPVDDAQAAAMHILELATDTERWRLLSVEAAETVRTKYSVGRMSGETLMLYESLVASREAILPRAA